MKLSLHASRFTLYASRYTLHASRNCPLHLSRTLYKSALFMQNKPNLLDALMNVKSILTKDYENKPRLPAMGKQTQSNPIKLSFSESSNRGPISKAKKCPSPDISHFFCNFCALFNHFSLFFTLLFERFRTFSNVLF